MAEKLMKYADATKKYDVVFGLETHVELSTNTKLFCPAHIEFGGEPNTELTPVSLGLPGSLPVINKTAVDYAIKLGLALHCEIAEWSQFARKNYFYPDMPRDYQISQYDKPTNGNGYLDVELEDGTVFRVPIERAHIEDDAGKNTHVGGADGRIEGADHSLVDYNRAGVPLIEIVTKPIEGAGDRAPEIAGAYVRAIRDIVRALNISHARMEQGNMRADVNVSLRPSPDAPYGTRSETKNVNSFRGIEKTIQYEIRRQAARLDDGKEILQETRHWDEATQTTAGGRLKSDADDYRYFPDPDLVMLHITKEHIEEMKAQMPEMPRERRNRLKSEWSQFARKNYFYPDMPRDYQISQYDKPTNGNGYLDVELEDGTVFRVPIERAHIEDDAGKNTHVGGADGRIEGADHSLVDYNRAGVPLIEIVTKPIEGAGDRAPEIAGAYVRAIRDIVRALNISHARMEQGNMRADVNVSLRPSPDAPYGTRSETKNVNSFRGIEKTIQYEIRRQAARLDDGKEILQETRHWDEATQTTAGGRLKSDADDYRYFPDPDLVMLHITKEHIEEMKAQMPEMPRERRNRLKSEWGLSDLQMRDILNADALDLIEETVKAGAKAAGARKWWLGELSREANAKGVSLEELPITPADVAEVEKLIASGKLNDKLAKQTVEGVLKGEGTPDEVVKKHDYKIVEDNGAIEAAVDAAFEANPDVVEKLKSGNMKPMGVIIGAVMKATRGQADAKAVTKVVMGKIKG